MQIKSFEDLEKRPWEKDDIVVKKDKREDAKVVITSSNKDDSDFNMWDFELEKWVNANTTTMPSYKVPDDFFRSVSTISNNTGGEPLDLKTLNDAIQSLYNTGGVQSRPNNPSEVMLPGDRKYQLDEEGDIFFVEGKGLFCHNKKAGYDPYNSTYRCSICLKTYTSESVSQALSYSKSIHGLEEYKQKLLLDEQIKLQQALYGIESNKSISYLKGMWAD